MSRTMAKVRGQTFEVTPNLSKDELVDMLNQYHKGVIILCPDCHKVDIDPYTHFSKCDPLGQATRDYDWQESVGDRG